MNILEKIKYYACVQPFAKAMISDQEEITYQELELFSDYLASYLDQTCGENKAPIAVYGHKSVYMLICMLACVKSGRAYCPIDVSVPDYRIRLILDKMEPSAVLATENLNGGLHRIINLDGIKKIIQLQTKNISPDKWVKDEEVFYIIFTSGSTGEPKGVQITANSLNNYLEWSMELGSTKEEKRGKCFLNQAPFSFDLSVMDLYTCLASGGTLWTLSKAVQSDYRSLMESLEKSNGDIWVSTPSFAEICLTDKQFNEQLMPQLKTFLFCGETLTKETVLKLRERFPAACVVNTYGPTESTVAVTSVIIEENLCKEENNLPVGRPKPGTRIEIRDKDGYPVPKGQKGEILILGNTVSSGYYKAPELDKKAFFYEKEGNKTLRGYRTGDEGYLRNGMLYYCGRIDLQIKLHGYRIEIEDVENNLLKLKEIERAVVIPNIKDGKAKSLTAYIVYKGQVAEPFDTALILKKQLKEFLPDYMIPKKFIFLDEFPINNNGKIDRKLLGGLQK
ncbi:D-alanine--poly(phosphoribitol) ligase subunit DltA [Aminipila sp.]|uniref:D-alanine--poly(phosphoribitol) ligase subunit DltA n=2 Tax=Aminipila sp. TaxID=2060095 RepID=UPI001D537FEC|nr:D-alanine--poly(phosphoribitol) ligase subunit DltA [Aminipila sp.]MBE6035255.1 D-alanine--poly(phosphoribitol) ligase subunit DltA [Clostridiales bacterium]